MPTLERARAVLRGMSKVGAYAIYWDDLYRCFRVHDVWNPRNHLYKLIE